MIELVRGPFFVWFSYPRGHRGHTGRALCGAAGGELSPQALFDDWGWAFACGLWRAVGCDGVECRTTGRFHAGGDPCAFLLLRLSEQSKIKGDAAIGLIASSALAIGVIVTSLTSGMNADVNGYLFGSILAMSKGDVFLSLVLSAFVLVLFVLFYNKIFAVTFDEAFAQATGTNARIYNMLIALLTAVTIVVGMRIMGAMLISSLIIFPALTAMRVCRSFKGVVVTAAAVSVICFFGGMLGSFAFSTPAGATIVVASIVMFLLFTLAGVLKNRMF